MTRTCGYVSAADDTVRGAAGNSVSSRYILQQYNMSIVLALTAYQSAHASFVCYVPRCASVVRDA